MDRIGSKRRSAGRTCAYARIGVSLTALDCDHYSGRAVAGAQTERLEDFRAGCVARKRSRCETAQEAAMQAVEQGPSSARVVEVHSTEEGEGKTSCWEKAAYCGSAGEPCSRLYQTRWNCQSRTEYEG